MSVLLYFHGSDPESFDLIYIGALIISCIFCWGDKDVLGALVVLLGYWGLSKVIFETPDSLLYWCLIYGACIGLSIYYINHITAQVLLAITLFTIGAEVYWWSIEYPPKPRMTYLLGLLALTMWLRQVLYNRVFIMHEYLGYSAGKVALDTHLGSVLRISFILISLMILEYYARHIFGMNDLLIIYNLFTPITTIISAVILAIVYMHYFNGQSKKYLSV